MTRLLVSVRDVAEARVAANAGVAILDLKEPNAGSLGACDSRVWQQVADEFLGRCTLSVALGELGELSSEELQRLPPIDFAKIGMAGCNATTVNWPARWKWQLERLPISTGPVAVAYADFERAEAPLPSRILDVGQRIGCKAFLIDTYEKSGGCLFDFLRPAELRLLLDAASDAGMVTVLAGSLQGEAFQSALRLAPNYLAVRGAACRRGRSGSIDCGLVKDLVARVAARQLD